MTYEISGVPWLAVRVGRALERWGSRSARPIDDDELRQRRDHQRVHDAAVEARRSALTGMYHLLK
ncbi:MAG: hypothetical protein ABI566_01565 [Pseudolysinimonas sp.]